MPKPVWNGRKCLIWSCSTLLYFIKCCFLSQVLRCKQPEARHSQKGTVLKASIPDGKCELWLAVELCVSKQSKLLWHRWSWAIPSECFQITVALYHVCDFIKFSPNHPEKLCPGSAPPQQPSPSSLCLILCYTQELGADKAAPDLALQPLSSLSSPRDLAHRDSTEQSSWWKGCSFYYLALPASSTFRWQHYPMGHHSHCCRDPGNWVGISTPPCLLAGKHLVA